MSEALRQWLATELNRRGMSHTQLANQIGLSHSFVSKVISGAKPPSVNFCFKTAIALDVAPERLLRLAGILPGESAPTSPGPITVEIMAIVESLPPELRQQVLNYVKFLGSQQQ